LELIAAADARQMAAGLLDQELM